MKVGLANKYHDEGLQLTIAFYGINIFHFLWLINNKINNKILIINNNTVSINSFRKSCKRNDTLDHLS